MRTFYATFGDQHPRELHPTYPQAHRDGYVAIEAETRDEAMQVAFATFGQTWSMLYDGPPDLNYFPLGELDRLTANETRSQTP